MTTPTSDTWAGDMPNAPHVGDVVSDRAGHRWHVVHVGRAVWLRPAACTRHDAGTILLEPARGFWHRYGARQLSLQFAALAVLVLLASILSGCLTLTGIATAPNGALWLGGNIPMDGPAVYSCTPHGGEMHCTRVPLTLR
jgi:hypothetical protein